jgi:hypothetical protein
MAFAATGTYTRLIYDLNLSTVQSISQECGNVTSAYVSIPGADSYGVIEEGNVSSYPDYTNISNLYEFSDIMDGEDIVSGNNITFFDVLWLEDDNYKPRFNTSSYASFDSDIVLANNTSIYISFTIDDPDREQNILAINVTPASSRLLVRTSSYVQLETDTNGQQFSLYVDTDTLTGKEVHILIKRYSDDYTVYYYDDSGEFETNSVSYPNSDDTTFNQIGDMGYRGFNGTINKIIRYDSTSVDLSDFVNTVTIVNGTAARTLPNGTWTPVIDGSATLPVDSTVSSIEVVDSNDGTYDVTTTTSYVQDTIPESQSESNNFLYAQINATPTGNYSEWNLTFAPVTTNFTYNLSLSTTDVNASGTFHDCTAYINTTNVQTGVSYIYDIVLSTLDEYTQWLNVISKSSTKVVFEFNSTDANVEKDIYLQNMSASSTFDLKYSNNTIISNVTSDSSGYLQFEDQYLINGTYTVEKQTSAVSFVAVVFTGLSFVGLYFANRFRRR